MIGKDNSVKISDFGLALKLVSSSITLTPQKMETVATKWTAPECISTRTFSLTSDVWSFGVVIWELMTNGKVPYPALGNAEYFKEISSGTRLEFPLQTEKAVSEIANLCWKMKDSERPTFRLLMSLLKNVNVGSEKPIFVDDQRASHAYEAIDANQYNRASKVRDSKL